MNNYQVESNATGKVVAYVEAHSRSSAVTNAASAVGFDANAKGSAIEFFKKYSVVPLLDCINRM